MEKPKSFSVYVKTQCLSSSRWRSLSFDEHNHASPTQELQSYPAQEVSPASSRIPLATNVLRNHPSPTLSLPPHEHFLLIIRKAGCSRPYQRISLSLSCTRSFYRTTSSPELCLPRKPHPEENWLHACCVYHMDTPGQKTKNCWELKYKVLDLKDVGVIIFDLLIQRYEISYHCKVLYTSRPNPPQYSSETPFHHTRP